MELSYSFHLGNDSNKTIKARQQAKNTLSQTTTKGNSAIQNVKQLGKVNHHNLRLYDNNQELIITLKGTNDIVKDVKELYLDLFEESRLEYNKKQVRDDRKIDNYFNKISNDDKHDLACEIIIELGDLVYWDDKSLEDKYKMANVFEKQLADLKEIVPNFYIANATCHFDEHSPHLHIIGVPVKENCKTGLSKQVGKTSIFTKESLVVIQDKMRERCIKDFNEVYELDTKLKEKQKGKNRDYTPFERLKFNEKEKELKEQISNLEDEVSSLNENKESINKQITNLNKNKNDITDEIDKKKKLNNKIVIKSKNQLWEENQKLEEKLENIKQENYQLKYQYNELEEKHNYLMYYVKKFIDKMPQVIKDIVNKVLDGPMSVDLFKRQHDPEVLEKQNRSIRKFNLFNKSEINKSLKHINDEMEESAEDFYTKKDKGNDDLSL